MISHRKFVFFFAVSLACLVCLWQANRSDDRFVSIFRQSMANGSHDDGYQLNRWGSNFDVCIYGGRTELAKKRIELFFSMVKKATWLRPSLQFHKSLTDCPEKTFLFIRVHNNPDTAKIDIIHDLSRISSQKGYSEQHNTSFNKYGMATLFAEPGKGALPLRVGRRNERRYIGGGHFIGAKFDPAGAVANIALCQRYRHRYRTRLPYRSSRSGAFLMSRRTKTMPIPSTARRGRP